MVRPTVSSISALTAVLVVCCLVGGCSDDDSDPGPVTPEPTEPTITVTPDTLLLTETVTEAIFELACDQADVAWRITGAPAWATVTPDTGTTTGAPTLVTVTTQPDTLGPGSRTALLEVSGTAKTVDVRLILEVGVTRQMAAAPDTLRWPVDSGYADLELTNSGNTGVSWSLHPEVPWLQPATEVGFCGPGATRTIRIGVQRGTLAAGSHLGILRVESNADNGVIAVPARMEVAATPRISVEPDSLIFDYFDVEEALTVINRGNTTVDWSAGTDAAYLSLDPIGGTLEVGESTTVTVTVDRNEVAAGENLATIDLGNGADQTVHLGVRVMHYPHPYRQLSHAVLDAEYDHVNDRMVTIPQTGNWLYRIGPGYGAVDSLALELAPRCVSISPDGSQCVVGHDGRLSWIDLDALQVLEVYDVSCDVSDIVMSGADMAYSFPLEDQWEQIRCTNLVGGAELLHEGLPIREGTRAKLHPSGQWIYGATNGIYPPYFEKYDITTRLAVYVDASYNHGNYAVDGDLWISDDGAYVLVRAGSVFHASGDPEIDMEQTVILQVRGTFAWMETAAAANRIYALSDADGEDGYLQVFDLATFADLGSVDLPLWPRPETGAGSLEPTAGHFVFARPAGAGVHVLVSPATGDHWAVVSFDAADLP